MTMSLIRRRVEKLAAKLSPTSARSFTLEELCRLLWRRDKARFLAMMAGDCRPLRTFVPSFERDDAEHAMRGRAPRVAQSYGDKPICRLRMENRNKVLTRRTGQNDGSGSKRSPFL
jgi:hypothetical protein